MILLYVYKNIMINIVVCVGCNEIKIITVLFCFLNLYIL